MKMITVGEVKATVRRYRASKFDQVHWPTSDRVSGQERELTLAMSREDDDSVFSDIPERMGASAKIAGVFRIRLLAKGVIGASARGMLRFAVPFSREYVRCQ